MLHIKIAHRSLLESTVCWKLYVPGPISLMKCDLPNITQLVCFSVLPVQFCLNLRFTTFNHLGSSETLLSSFEAKYPRLGYSENFVLCAFTSVSVTSLKYVFCTWFQWLLVPSYFFFSLPCMFSFPHSAWNGELQICFLGEWMLSVYVRRFCQPKLNARS